MKRLRFRYLRIAFSITCGIACVLLIVLWVRSYWWGDTLMGRVSQSRALSFSSAQGRLSVRWDYDQRVLQTTPGWHLQHISVVKMEQIKAQIMQSGWPASVADDKWGLTGDSELRTPIWLSVLLIAALAAAPGIRWPQRFSLRTLLIASTLVAVGLGLIAWLR